MKRLLKIALVAIVMFTGLSAARAQSGISMTNYAPQNFVVTYNCGSTNLSGGATVSDDGCSATNSWGLQVDGGNIIIIWPTETYQDVQINGQTYRIQATNNIIIIWPTES
jgi:hypothetical protein